MRCFRLFRSALPNFLESMIELYAEVYSDTPWHEHHTHHGVRTHLLWLTGSAPGEPVLCTVGDRLCGAAIGVVLHAPNPILQGLSGFGAADGDYYLSEFPVRSGCGARNRSEVAAALLHEIRAIAAQAGASYLWARTHPQANFDQDVFRNAQFDNAGEYSDGRRRWVVYKARL